MKSKIHPNWHQATVTCACGNTFVVGATVKDIQVEVCYACHPFYTGQMKFIDTAGRVDAFKDRQKKAQKTIVSKAEKRKRKREKKIQKELDRPDTLEALRNQSKESKKS
jgi:large subunit ribosomal protein L31